MRYHNKTQNYLYSNSHPLTAAKIVNTENEKAIAKMLRRYSGERYAKKIARAIVKARQQKPIKTTAQLVEIIKGVVPKDYEKGRIHPATRTFQALRIAVNAELENLKTGLGQAWEALEPRGRLVVISFHSLEDKIVKDFLKNRYPKGLSSKPIRPSAEEIETNPGARSARMRVGQK